MEINLLPKVPKEKRFRFPISLAVAIIVLIPSGFIAWDALENRGDLVEQQRILQDLVNKSNYYSQQLAENKNDSQAFGDYFTELDLIRNQQIDWVLVFDELANKLPADGKIINLAYNGGDNLMMDVDFSSLNIGAQYIQLLETILWVDEIISVQSSTQAGNYQLELKIAPQTLLKGGEINE